MPNRRWSQQCYAKLAAKDFIRCSSVPNSTRTWAVKIELVFASRQRLEKNPVSICTASIEANRQAQLVLFFYCNFKNFRIRANPVRWNWSLVYSCLELHNVVNISFNMGRHLVVRSEFFVRNKDIIYYGKQYSFFLGDCALSFGKLVFSKCAA